MRCMGKQSCRDGVGVIHGVIYAISKRICEGRLPFRRKCHSTRLHRSHTFAACLVFLVSHVEQVQFASREMYTSQRLSNRYVQIPQISIFVSRCFKFFHIRLLLRKSRQLYQLNGRTKSLSVFARSEFIS